MSLDDLPAGAPPRPGQAAEAVVRRVDRASPYQDKITRAEELRLQLADEIVRGALPPGAALDETDIARRFKVSRTPVREALRQLVASGLVDARAHRGAVVARPSIERLTGMFEAMAELEALCAGLAAERMSPAERHRLEAVHEELRVLSYAGNPDRFHEVNERFHNAIYAGSQNGYIAEITLATRVRVQPFRRCRFNPYLAPPCGERSDCEAIRVRGSHPIIGACGSKSPSPPTLSPRRAGRGSGPPAWPHK